MCLYYNNLLLAQIDWREAYKNFILLMMTLLLGLAESAFAEDDWHREGPLGNSGLQAICGVILGVCHCYVVTVCFTAMLIT